MSDTWNDIYGPDGLLVHQRGVPPIPPVGKPLVRRGHARCPEDCSGQHTRDSVLCCPQCGGIAYEIIGHSYPDQEGHFWWERKPVNGSPVLPAEETNPCCRDCGCRLVRR